jgi:CRISPR-associated endonuclease/helicase Cas3
MSETSVFTDPRGGFSSFYREVHADPGRSVKAERDPYEWQTRLAAQLVTGRVPDDLVAPTGAGKTTLIEAFLYALAWQLHHDEERSLPLRLFWVVDRRAVVDQVHRHAEHVTARIYEATASSGLDEVRQALRRLHAIESRGDDQGPVGCHRWRGGSGLRPTTLRPDRAAIVCSTVDQVGSRLLFRGYGVSRSARPLEAALVGTDSLIVVDEAHISRPFTETAAAVVAAQRTAPQHPGRPLRTMRMSATLPDEGDGEEYDTFRLTEGELAEPRLARTINAEKLVRVGRPARTRVGGLVAAATEMARDPGLVGVIANTVDEARQVHAELSKEHEAWLLIGPNRPILREGLIESIPTRAQRSGGESKRPKPKVVVATQTIEVGVDLDFDSLVTACAPLDALAQRLGRLDRAGAVGKTRAVVVHSREPCPVYGETTARAWALLEERMDDGTVDLGARRITELLAALPVEWRREVTSEAQSAPLLAPWHIEALSQTSDDPVPSPDIALFLHGDETVANAEVNVVWRADLVRADSASESIPDWADRVRARPPHPDEAISLPIHRVRNWLQRRHPTTKPDHEPTADIESLSPPISEFRPVTDDSLPFVLVVPDQRGRQVEATTLRTPQTIAPGSTIVVPRTYGCCDEFGWITGTFPGHSRRAPGEPEDLGDLDPAQPRLLFDPRLLDGREDDRGDLAKATYEVQREMEETFGDATKSELYRRLREPVLAWARAVWGDATVDSEEPGAGPSRRRLRAYSEIEEAIRGTVRFIRDRDNQEDLSPPRAFVLEPDAKRSEFWRPRHRVTLTAHSELVAQRGRQLAEVVSEKPEVWRTVEIAGRYHDHGKLDPRFQRWMYLDEEPDRDTPLAKSGISSGSWLSNEARIAASWPKGKRHESLSALLLARSSLATNDEVDIHLATYLVAVHHGRNRPFLSSEHLDPHPTAIEAQIEGETVTLSSAEDLDWGSHASTFTRLNQRHSPWGLALIEAALIQADWLASEEEQSTSRERQT